MIVSEVERRCCPSKCHFQKRVSNPFARVFQENIFTVKAVLSIATPFLRIGSVRSKQKSFFEASGIQSSCKNNPGQISIIIYRTRCKVIRLTLDKCQSRFGIKVLYRPQS